jgi:hypothetical protein
MSYVLVQHATATAINSASTISATFGSNSTAGNLLVACISSNAYTGYETYTAPSGWTAITGDPLQSLAYDYLTSGAYYYEDNPGGIKTVTFTFGGTAILGASLVICEFSGVDTSSPLDVSAIANSIANPPAISTTTNGAGELVIGFACPDCGQSGVPTFTQPSGWTLIANSGADGNSATLVCGGYIDQASAGSITYNPARSVNDNCNMVILAFKPASGGGGTVNGGGSLITNEAITEAALILAPGNLIGNALLSSPAALIMAPGHLISNSVVDQLSAKIITYAQDLISDSVISGAARLVASPQDLQSNSVLEQLKAAIQSLAALIDSAQIQEAARLVTSADLISNSILGSGLITGGGSLTSNSVLTAAAIILTAAELQDSVELVVRAQVLATGILIANAGLPNFGALVVGSVPLIANAVLTGFSGPPPPQIYRYVKAFGVDGTVTAYGVDGTVTC